MDRTTRDTLRQTNEGDTSKISSNATMTTPTLSQYDQQAADFLAKHGIKCRITLSNTKPAPFGSNDRPGSNQEDRNHYRVTLSKGKPCTPEYTGNIRSAARLTFDFWGSINDARNNVAPSAYDILTCVNSDSSCPDSFADFCAEYGYDEDSIKARQLFRRCDSFAKRIRAFFTAAELESLSEIN